MKDLMNDDDRKALSMNKYEELMTLAELQDRMKRQPEHYRNEFKAHFEIFVKKLREFKENPAKKETDFTDYIKFMAHVSKHLKTNLLIFDSGLRRIQGTIGQLPLHRDAQLATAILLHHEP